MYSSKPVLICSLRYNLVHDYDGNISMRDMPKSLLFGRLLQEAYPVMEAFQSDLYHDAVRLHGMSPEDLLGGFYLLVTASSTHVVMAGANERRDIRETVGAFRGDLLRKILFVRATEGERYGHIELRLLAEGPLERHPERLDEWKDGRGETVSVDLHKERISSVAGL